MATYTVQDTTMTALGDAVRKHLPPLIEVNTEEKSNLFHLEIKNTADLNIEDLQIENGRYYYILPLPKYNSWYSFAYSYYNSNPYDIPIYLRFYNSDGSIKFEDDIITLWNRTFRDRTIKNTYYTNSQYYYGYDPYLVISIPSFDLEINFILDMYVYDEDNVIYYDIPRFTPAEMAQFINDIELQDITITENGTYTADENYFGINEVNVNVPNPELEEITITENGTYLPDAFGFSEVEVNVEPTLESITITENGTYTPQENIDGYNEIIATITPSLPDEAKIITGNCNYRFANGGWDWFLNAYGDQLETYNINSAQYMFSEASKINYIPFDINVSNTASINRIFEFCQQLKEVPYVISPERTPPTSAYSGTINLEYIFQGCYRLKEIPYDWFWKLIPNKEYWDAHQAYGQPRGSIFWNCYSLREIPDISMLSTTQTYGTLYNYAFTNCYVLNKVINLPVIEATLTSNQMGQTFNECYRLNEITFATNEDGTPKTANWKNQTLALNKLIGYTNIAYKITNYNSGITRDKEVYDDATYQALKNDPDWFSSDINYSRYNHDSAVNTINSLPDTSAYGTNTITFTGSAGALTDGGAINTLTEEEIAVATSRGWTVSLV